MTEVDLERNANPSSGSSPVLVVQQQRRRQPRRTASATAQVRLILCPILKGRWFYLWFVAQVCLLLTALVALTVGFMGAIHIIRKVRVICFDYARHCYSNI